MMTVYITRANHWWNDSRRRAPITMEEWSSYADADPELVSVPYTFLFPSAGGIVAHGEMKGTWEWLGRPDYAPMCEEAVMAARTWDEFLAAIGPRTYFSFNGNGIQIGAEDDPTFQKAKQIAAALHANAIDDHDRQY